jgi:hypothetical protein
MHVEYLVTLLCAMQTMQMAHGKILNIRLSISAGDSLCSFFKKMLPNFTSSKHQAFCP